MLLKSFPFHCFRLIFVCNLFTQVLLIRAAEKCSSSDFISFQCKNIRDLNDLNSELNSIATLKNLRIENDRNFSTAALRLIGSSPSSSSYARRLEKLDLSQNNLASLNDDDDGFEAFESLTHLNISNCHLDILRHNHFAAAENNNLQYIDASWNELDDLPLELLQRLQSLRSANFSHNAIKSIRNGSFEKSMQLEHLDLSYNEMRNVIWGVAANLLIVNLNHNLIETLTFNDIAQSPYLQEVHLFGNTLNGIEEGIFAEYAYLRLMNLSSNSLKALHAATFLGLRRLLHLDVSENDLEQIDRECFQKTPKLQILDLSGNSLDETLDVKTFQNLTALRKLFLQRNNFARIGDNMFAGLLSLDTLDLSENSLEYFGSNVFGPYTVLPKLRKLSLKSNNLKHLHPLAFSSVPFLEYLSLGNNELTALDVRMFAPLRRLEKLHLGNNRLEDIPADVLDSLDGLNELLIDNNRLTYLQSGASSSFPYLKRVAIEGNPWQCACLHEILDWLHRKNIEYVRLHSPYYRGERPMCLISPSVEESCVKDLKVVRAHGVADAFDDGLLKGDHH